LTQWSCDFLQRELPLLVADRDLAFHYKVSNANTAGYPADDFAPPSMAALRQTSLVLSSDKAAICTQFPLTTIENMVLDTETLLTSDEFRTSRPWLGSDIKIMACGSDRQLYVTVCVPQIADYVPDLSAYSANLESIRNVIHDLISSRLPGSHVEINLNTLDDYEQGSLYLTVLGSCIESGDEGMVGRGNRPSGVISMARAHSGEAACGKNPVFFPGKVYTAAGKAIAQGLHDATGSRFDVWLLSQEGRPLRDPWRVIVWHDGTDLQESTVRAVIENVLARIPDLTESMLRGEVRLC
jgi:S-adenosylmethionine synthetase